MILIILFVILTTLVLLLGLLSMAAGEKISKEFGTKLMSLRVIFQALAILVLILAYFTTS